MTEYNNDDFFSEMDKDPDDDYAEYADCSPEDMPDESASVWSFHSSGIRMQNAEEEPEFDDEEPLFSTDVEPSGETIRKYKKLIIDGFETPFKEIEDAENKYTNKYNSQG